MTVAFDVSTTSASTRQCLQAAISPGRTDSTMTDKRAGAGSERNAKSKEDAGKDARAKDSPAAAKSETSGSHSSPKKRRKVNHGKVPLRMRQGSWDLPSRVRMTI